MNSTALQRFWAKVQKTDGCWIWTGSLDSCGYGRFRFGGGLSSAHRFAYECIVGSIPDGYHIDHRATCPKNCVNPAHLRPVTRKQNMENRAGANSNSRTGVRGVFERGGRYRVTVGHNQKLHHFGTYDTLAEAEEVVRRKRIELFTHNDLDR